ncbi:MAG TPA: hypothetical protein DEV81_17255 [Cyanobacteria bacterium UBA11049]|nr:hypothetical protein [Cyanobacteria bacterium UBA11049]
MSKFEELCYAYNYAHNQMSEYLEACVQFIQDLIAGMEVYLECPDKRIQHKNKMGEETSLKESMYLENEFWHFNTEITMCKETAYRRRAISFARCYYPRQTILLPFIMKRVTADLFVVGIDSYPEQFTIDVSDRSSFEAFYEFVFESIQTYYKNIFQLIMEHNESPKEIQLKYVENRF